ncbi:MAG: ATP-binding protein [Planctomycetia bacterium]|jgi:SpoVK/Ycf46/Vps4 family AAA+-type ATPase|nr:ATP-binding protein [Planctomycetia bacterium]
MSRKSKNIHKSRPSAAIADASDWDWEPDVPVSISWENPHHLWARHYALRILSSDGRRLGSHWWFMKDDFAQELLEWDEHHYQKNSVHGRLRRARSLLKRQKIPETTCVLDRNVDVLASRLGLGGVEQKIIRLAALVDEYPILGVFFEDTDDWNTHQNHTRIAIALDLDQSRILQALGPREVLRSSGLLKHLERDGFGLMPSLAAALLKDQMDEAQLFSGLFQSLPPSQFTLTDFPHLQTHSRILTRLLTGAQQDRVQGVHILLHGAPGTGKTAYARALAASMAWGVVEVRHEDIKQEPLEGDTRFQAFALCQQALAKQSQTLILFDEVEDVFGEPPPWFPLPPRHKAWTNHLLEQAKVPTVWITNRIENIDPAYRRRFLYTLNFRNPPKPVRQKMLDAQMQSIELPAGQTALWAERTDLSPGRIQQASKIANLCRPEAATESAELIEHVWSLHEATHLSSPWVVFDPTLIESDPDLNSVLSALKQHQNATLLFHGPSGTGKTAFARHLADQLGKTLYTRSPSDLLSKYVGENEQNLAAAFREALGEILFLDEVDSFLQERTHAQHPWEISMVNELLQRMESFAGILILATNLPETLDRAMYRRMDLSIGFQPLGKAKRQYLWQQLLKALEIPDAPDYRQKIASLAHLVPADLARAIRRHRFQPFLEGKDLWQFLEHSENQRRRGTLQEIGFIAH